jgi:formyl-CoA transferase
MVASFPDAPGVGRDARVLHTGIKLNGEAPAVDAPPPLLGQHTDLLLAELGYAADEILSLRKDGAI